MKSAITDYSLKTIIRDNRYLLLLLYLPVYLIAFFVIDNLPAEHYIITCGLDELIPFNEYFIIFYSLWFLWYPGWVLFFVWHSVRAYLAGDKSDSSMEQADIAKADFIKLCMVMFASTTLSLITYIVWPNGIDLREPIASDNIFARAVGWIRAADTPYGVCPSIHIATITAELLVISDSRLRILQKGIKPAALIITLLIAYSTLAIKQHSIIDVAAGAILPAVLYAVYKAAYKYYHQSCRGT